jgi:hypothetical protein
METSGNGTPGNGKPTPEDLRRMELAILDGIPPPIAEDDERRLLAADPRLGAALAKLKCWGACSEADPCANCLAHRRKLALELQRERFGRAPHPSDCAYPTNPDADDPPRAGAPSMNGDTPAESTGASWEPIIPLPDVPDADPFPLDVLPAPQQRFVTESSWALNCPPDYLAVPLLVLAGAGIGASRALEIKSGWRERPALYAAVVAPPGSTKSPALRKIAKPIYEAQATRHKGWKMEMQEWREGNEQGRKPTLETLFVRDATTEALGPLLQDNPRGVVMLHDELTAWVSALDQYRARGRGTDRQFYLSAWAGEPVAVHRKNQDDGPLFVPHPFLAVVGPLPPDRLDQLRGERNVNDGFLDRVLFSFPAPMPAIGEDWRAVEDDVDAIWADALGKLWELQPDLDAHGNPRPHAVYLDATGRKAWERFTRDLADEMNAANFPDVLRGPWAKMRGYGARLALIVHLLHGASGTCADGAATGAMIGKAAALVRYFQSHARKVYALLGTDGELDGCRRVLEWIERERPKTFKPWELHKDVKNQGQFPRAKDLDGPLERLVRHNYIRPLLPVQRAGPGRRESSGYEVNPAVLDHRENRGNRGNSP